MYHHFHENIKRLKPNTYFIENVKSYDYRTYNHLIFCTLKKNINILKDRINIYNS